MQRSQFQRLCRCVRRELGDGMRRRKTTILRFASCIGKWSRYGMGCVPVSKKTLAAVNLLTSKSYPKHIWGLKFLTAEGRSKFFRRRCFQVESDP